MRREGGGEGHKTRGDGRKGKEREGGEEAEEEE